MSTEPTITPPPTDAEVQASIEDYKQCKLRIFDLEDQVGVRDGETLEQRVAALMQSHGATYQPLRNRISELEAWKESAMKVMPDFQAIGKALGLKLGEDVSPQILPRIQAMSELLDAVSNLEHHEFKRRWDELKGQP